MSVLIKIGQLGHLDNDTQESKIQKSFLVYLAIFMSVGGVVWGTICLYYALIIPALFPFSYALISFINLMLFKSTKKFSPVRFVQVLISLILPVGFQWMLGGFSSSGSIILWSLLALIASLSFNTIEASIRWLVFFIVLTLGSAFLDGNAQLIKPEILPSVNSAFAATNIILISSIVFGLVAFFVGQYEKTKKIVEQKNRQVVRMARELKQNYQFLQKSYDSLKEDIESDVTSEAIDQYENILTLQKKMLDGYQAKKV